MIESTDTSLINWSRAQFALTATYYRIFVPLTLGLVVVMGIMETSYYRMGNEFWRRTAKFRMKIFDISSAAGVAAGLILELELGTNWSNYSWFVGDILGAPLVIEGILAFFVETTFIAVMFFGWDKVNKGFHLTSIWLTGLEATISVWWILVTNVWMQHPVGMEFNPDTVCNETVDFVAVAFSPVVVNKFCHTVLSSWVLGAAFVIDISCWFLLKKRGKEFAITNIKIGAIFGLIASVLAAWISDGFGYAATQIQPMKPAAVEGHYEGQNGAGLIAIGVLNPDKKTYDDGQNSFLFRVEIPKIFSFLAERKIDAFVPGIRNIAGGEYEPEGGTKALPVAEKIERGKKAIIALGTYHTAKKDDDEAIVQQVSTMLKENVAYFGYGYIRDMNQLVPDVPLNFYVLRVIVTLGGYFILLFTATLFSIYKKDLSQMWWTQCIGPWTIPLTYIAGQAEWVVAECGRQPWAIRDTLPMSAAISKPDVSSVQATFFIFLTLFTAMLIAEIGITTRKIKKGPAADH